MADRMNRYGIKRGTGDKNNRGSRRNTGTLTGTLKRSLRRAKLALRARWQTFTAWLSGISIDKQSIFRALICTGLVVFFALLETTFFGKFRPFGAVPDLMLPLVVALGMSEGGGWGGAFGIIAGIVIDSLGNTAMTLHPLIFCLAGFFAGLLLEEQFSDTLAVRAIMIAASALLRSVITLIGAALALPDFSLSYIFPLAIAPEFAATLIMGVIPHLAAYFSLRWAHKSRSELTSD